MQTGTFRDNEAYSVQEQCHRPEKRNSKVSWYRNTFGETAPVSKLPSEPCAMDAPIVLPADLRPLTTKRRYVRTMQLVADAPVADDVNREEGKCTETVASRPVSRMLRHDSMSTLMGTRERHLLKAMSHAELMPERRKRSVINKAKATEVHANVDTKALGTCYNQELTLNGDHATAQAVPYGQSSQDEATLHRDYFGTSAKEKFYAQYRQLYSRPYLFIEHKGTTSGTPNTDVPPFHENKARNGKSTFVPMYPSSLELKSINDHLTPPHLGPRIPTAMDNPLHLPVRDHLSPRAHFLASCASTSHAIVPFLIRSKATKVFDFSYQSLGDKAIASFATSLKHNLPNVEEISVRDNRLTDNGLNVLLLAISRDNVAKTLRRLDISQNEIGFKSARTLESYIVSSTCTLETLHVDNADIDDHECAAFMTAFTQNQSITRLDMSRNGIGKAETLNVVQPQFITGGEAIANMLHVNSVLVHLDLSWNYLRLESSLAVAKSLRDNRTLLELKLAYNACADAGAMMFGEALRFNHRLERLDLSYNSIGVKGAMVLANALRFNTTLRVLQLNGNNIGREGGQLFMAAVCATPSELGCTIELHACNLGATLLPLSASDPRQPRSADFRVQDLPVFNATSTRVFNPREPAGRYVLNLQEPYDKTIAMELVRFATTRKGGRFVRVAYKPLKGPTKLITLVKKENLVIEHHQGAGSDQRGESTGEETTLETRGLDALFANVDRDQSGTVDVDELLAVLTQIGLTPHVESVTRMLANADYNGSGFLEEGEFSAFFFHAMFQLMDEDESGKIDADEVAEAFQLLGIMNYTEKEIAEAIATYDLSGDDEMEEYEFVEFMKGQLLDRIKWKLLREHDATGQASLVSVLDASTQTPWVIPEVGHLEIDFVYDRESFATSDEAFRQGKISRTGLAHLIRNITQVATSKSEQDDLFHVAMYDSEIRLSAVQAHDVLEACQYLKPESTKLDAIACMLPQMLTTKEAQSLVARTLTLMQRCRLKARMGSAYSVVLGNPTAHYSFDLAKHKDRIAVTKLAEVAQSEKLFSKLRSGRGDTSQHGNWENFRNEELDGHRLVLTNTFFHALPSRGKLSFDYVSTTRPKRGTTQISDRRFDQLIELLQIDVLLPEALVSLGPTRAQRARGLRQPQQEESGGHDVKPDPFATFPLTCGTKENVGLKLVQIESAICDRWLSCEQAAKIIACMPTTFHARPETARILFSRLIDVHQFYRIFDAMSRPEQQSCARTLGWLNIMNPMVPERFYALNLSIYDEREMTKVLVELAIGEPGENWLNQSFTLVYGEPGIPGWKLPVRWEKEDNKEGGVNRVGFLELEYTSRQDQGCAPVPSLRKALMKRVLCGSRLYCL